MFQAPQFSLSITMAACLWAAAVPAASAATVTTQPGASLSFFDPMGSGRSAQVALVSGRGELTFSNGQFDGVDVNTLQGLVIALNVSNVAITAVAPASGTTTFQDDGFGEAVRTRASVTAPVASVTLDNVSGQVESVASLGGTLLTGTRVAGTLTGGVASLTNLRFDLLGKTVTADLYGVKAPVGTRSAVTYDLPNTVLWKFDSVSGHTAIKPEYLLAADPVAALEGAGFQVQVQDGQYQFVAENVITGLRATTSGFNFFASSLGLLSTGASALRAINEDELDAQGQVLLGGYGTVTSRLTFSMTVPEPSTYALMALGLGLMALAVRRNKQRWA
jgi:PEP-CTERM motif